MDGLQHAYERLMYAVAKYLETMKRSDSVRLEQAQALVHVQEAKSLLDATCSAAHAELEHHGQQIKVWEHQHMHGQG